MNEIIILGASGHARVCMDILEAQGKTIVGFCDDNHELNSIVVHGHSVLGDTSVAISLIKEKGIDYFVAIGNNEHRKKVGEMMQKKCNKSPINAIHPSAVISPNVTMGCGNFIAPGAIINIDTKLMDFTIINTGATLDHDNYIQSYAQISPGCNIAGNVMIEEGAFLGTGAVVLPELTIGTYAIIGAGAVVIRDIPPFTTAVGVPARVIKKNVL
jgi:sugar O-acyltransferase (sialic acid O-acetyltransferase NeuD family)